MTVASRPVMQMFEQIFGEAQIAENAGLGNLKSYLEQDGSIFPLVEKGVQGLVSEQQLSVDEARQFIRRANSLATYIRREFIEHTLKGDEIREADQSSGLLSMVVGPKYELLFSTRFDRMCPPEALESCLSPVAYLIDLLRWILLRIEPYGDDAKLPLHDRRTDLKLLSVDWPAVHQAVSSVDIIIAVLEKFITAHQSESIEDALINARYPNGLPYYQHWVTIDGVARSKGLSVGDFNRSIDLSYPYFLPSFDSVSRNTRALAHASRLGPYQRNLLTEHMYDLSDAEAFYGENFDVRHPDLGNLSQVKFFGEATQLGTVAIERLLSVGEFAPVRSANIEYADATDGAVESARSGSVYINANVHPGIGIEYSTQDFLSKLTIDPVTQVGLTAIDRMNRKLRLDSWLELPSEEVDVLLTAAIRAEARGKKSAPIWEISDDVVHALGLFQHLRERYRCTAADFAVIIDQFSIYGRGETLSQFDQIFNGQGAYREPLKLGDGLFPVTPVPGEADLTISQLCNGLGIDLQTYHYLALAVAGAYRRTDTLLLTPAIVSSLCRLVILPRLFNMTPVEGVLMLTLLGGQQWLDGLAGEPLISASASSTPDVLSLVEAMDTCVQWCEHTNLPVLWMLQHVAVPQRVSVASESDLQFFDQVTNLLPASRFSNNTFLTAGVPSVSAFDWLDFLSTSRGGVALVDHYGLVLPYAGTLEEYEAVARMKLLWVVESAFGGLDESLHGAIVDTMLAVLLQTRDAQVALVKETMAVYAAIPAEHVTPILGWANSTTHFLLDQVVAHTAQERRDAGGPLFDLLAEVRRRSEVAMTLNLSVELLQDYLDYGHKVWFGKAPNAEPELSVRTLYYLSTLTRAFDLGRQPPHKLLDYLREVNALPEVTGNALWLAQQASAIRLAEFFGWSAQEVRDCLAHIDKSGSLVLGSLVELDLLMRVRVLSSETGMDASTIFQIGNLPETVDKEAYAKGAELALLNEARQQVPLVHAPGDLKALVKTRYEILDSNYLIAKKPGEKATYRVTVTDAANVPLSGVNVYWHTTLGTMSNKATDINGQVEVEYWPGEVMGTDRILYRLDFFDPEPVDPVVIIFDSESMWFPIDFTSPTPLGIVPRGQEVELYAIAEDKYANIGKDVLVKWLVTSVPASRINQAIIRPADGFTNQEGVTRVVVSSRTGGTFEFSVLAEGGENQTYFEPITFAGDHAEQ